MNLRDLQYLVAVAELRNFSQAAEQCHVSQPTLSNQIKKLEDTLGATLFERTNKRVILTDVGAQVLASARRILKEVEVMHETAALAHNPLGGTFRLGAFPTLASYIFPQLVPKIKETMPELRVILIEEKTQRLVEMLRAGELDAALLALPVDDDFLISEPLLEDEFYLAVPEGHELSMRNSVTIDELSGYHLLLLEEGHCLRDQALEVCRLSGADEQDFRAAGLETLRQMVKAGTGITIMPEIAIQPDETGICYIPFEAPVPTRIIGLVYRKTTSREACLRQLVSLI